MKKMFFIFLYFGIICSLHAQNNRQQVSLSEAEQAALNRINASQDSQQAQMLTSYQKKDNAGNVILYEIVTEKTSILLSGSKACTPILGEYSSSNGSIIENYDNLPCNLRFIVDGYISQIEKCFYEGVDRNYHQGTWDSLINGVESLMRFPSVEPLIFTRWKQRGCNTGYGYGYEYYIPGIPNDCDHCSVGCGAVAMGQVMKYWNYPVVRYNQVKQFDWCNMSMDLNTTANTFMQNREAIAWLLWDCWPRILDRPHCNWTFSSFDSIRNALVNAYGYDSHARIVNRNGYSGDWDELIIDQLRNGMPILYSGEGHHGKHTFICCGVNSHGMFYINWGNGGDYDGYFETNNLHYYDTSFSHNQRIIINIVPSTHDDMCNKIVSLDMFYNSFYSIAENSVYSPLEIIPQTMTTLTSAPISSNASWRTIPTDSTAVYQAHKEIILQDGFEAQLGCEFEARIEPCEQCEELRGESSSEYDEDVARDDYYSNDENLYSTARMPQTTDPDLFPNPTDGPLTMSTDGEPQQVFVHTFDGRLVGGWKLTALGDGFVTLDVSPLRPGPYLLSVTTPSGTRTARFLRH